jgi:cytosine/adenosine deaminase-related metal-dependent hydrolase
MRASAAVIWCPSSNLRLFGSTLDVTDLLASGRIALGSDSRLTGARDLLEELHIAAASAGLAETVLESLATRDNARLLRLADRGALREDARADILVLPRHAPLSRASRADVRLVMVGGLMRYGDKDYGHIVLDDSHWADVRVDGRPKVLERRLATLLQSSGINEEGLELPREAWRAA